MLKKEHRLKKDKNFKAVFKKSRPVFFDNFTIRAAKSGEDLTRFGIVISAKTEKLAVRRNAMRRALQAAARDNIDKILPGYDIVITVKGKINFPVDRKRVADMFKEGIIKSGLLKSESANQPISRSVNKGADKLKR